MSLSAGATLQNQKYVIQKLLHQSDFGVTYEAKHVYLEQTVVLQTLNDALRQQEDFAQVRQQFLKQVRLMSKQAGQSRILDCFEEAELPYAVFEMSAQMPPQPKEWLFLSPHAQQDAEPSPTESPVASSTTLSAEPAALNSAHPKQVQDALLVAPASLNLRAAQSGTGQSNPIPSNAGLETQPPLISNAAPAQPTALTEIATHFIFSSKRKPQGSKGWMPLALVSISMLGGLLGVGFGLSVRLATTAQSEGSDTTPNLPPSLFSREQSFPSEADWPISEVPTYSADPTPIEQPVYRVSPSAEDYNQPILPSLPDLQIQQPVPLPDQPAIKTATPPQPPQPPLPVDRTPPSELPVPNVTTAPVEPVSPPAPAEPAAPPIDVMPELTAPIAPEITIPEPAAPALPAPEASSVKR